MQTIVPIRRRRYPQAMNPFQLRTNPFFGFEGKDIASIMRTDISETESSYDFSVELPGFAKEDVSAEIKDGYLVISASTHTETKEEEPKAEAAKTSEEQPEGEGACSCGCEQSEQKSSWLRRERYYGSCTRSYWVGDDIDTDSVSAKFENGLLSVSVPKKAPEPEQKKSIEIS